MVITFPKVLLSLEGVPLPEAQLQALQSIRVQQRLSQPTQCELVFQDPPGPLDVAAELQPGQTVEVALQEDHGATETLFTGEITAVELAFGPDQVQTISVRAYDLLHRLRKRQPVRAHVEATVHDLAQELVGDLGLSVRSEERGPLRKRLIQHDLTDLDFLVEQAAQVGLYLSLREETLHLLTLSGVGERQVLKVGESLLEARFELNSEPACRTVDTHAWNPLRSEVHRESSDSARVGTDIVAETAPDRFSESGVRSITGAAVEDANHASALAQGELDRRVAYETMFWGVAEGNPALIPGTPVQIEALPAPYSGQYVITSAIHTIDSEKGFTSELSSVPPRFEPQNRATNPVIAPGVVTQVNDPQRLGRVRVSLPTYNDLESEWLQVVHSGAGKNKGLIILPSVGDDVLILLSHGDPAQAVIIGGLFGMEGAPDSGVEGGSTRRYSFLTPGGQTLQLDDESESILMKDSSGNSVRLSPEHLRIHAAVDLEIEAPGQAVVIRGKTIDFEQA